MRVWYVSHLGNQKVLSEGEDPSTIIGSPAKRHLMMFHWRADLSTGSTQENLSPFNWKIVDGT